MLPDVRIHGLRVRNAFSFRGNPRGHFQKVGRSEKVSESWNDTWMSVPSWHKAIGLSSWLVTRQVNKAIRLLGKPDAILFTLPWYAKVAENFPGVIKAYYAHDTFRFYDWDRNKVIELEGRLLRSCNVGFAVARQVAEDLQALATTPVHYLPMATTWLPGATNAEGESAAEKDFDSVPKPRVGCVGQINGSSYDWDLIENLSVGFPEVQFVFIGPKFKERPSPDVNRMAAIFHRHNICWLGPKPHAHLPAYLRRLDVCINPLRVSEHNHRRSPLRLFDYLTTDRPIVSTAVAEACNHEPFVCVAKDNKEFRRLLGEALTLKVAPDLARRRNYITANTWHTRADEFWQRVNFSI